jgi:hypothetical protein
MNESRLPCATRLASALGQIPRVGMRRSLCMSRYAAPGPAVREQKKRQHEYMLER